MTLSQQVREIYYCATPEGFELDFYLPRQRRLVHVAQNLYNPATREREPRALADAIPSVKVGIALIISDSNGAGFEIKGVPVEVRSVGEWLLGQ